MRKPLSGLLGLGLCAAINAGAGIIVDFEEVTKPYYTDFVWTGWTLSGQTAANDYLTANTGAAVSRVDGYAFAFEGADFASAEDVTITATGWRNQQIVGTQEFVVKKGAGFTSFTSTLTGLDTLTFSGSGWQMDNFIDMVVVPEPTTMVAGALLILPFGLSTLCRMRKQRT